MIEVPLNGLQLENYRGFKRYRLSGLARVNLLVGKNNCGKTSILEAVQILASQGDHRILDHIATRRGEAIMDGEEGPARYSDISHFFHGHRLDLNERFRIANDDDSIGLSMQVKSISNPDMHDHKNHFDEDHSSIVKQGVLAGPRDILSVEIQRTEQRLLPTSLRVSAEGALFHDQSRPGRFGLWKYPKVNPIHFITPESFGFGPMGLMWNQIVVEGRESEVVQSLKILEPDLASIHFLLDDIPHRTAGYRVLAGFDDPKRKRVPLGSFGEGMRRMLALSLSLNQAQGGILLVDEIDTGLHYSILGDMWLLVVKAAIQYNLQVFATTHSLDCIRGLAWLCENHPELAGEVSVQKIDERLEEAVALDSNQLRIAVEQDIEVR